jgi:hypothetical protein
MTGNWLDIAARIDALEDAGLDRVLVREMQDLAERRGAQATSAVRFHVPSFKGYASSEIPGCGKRRWPAVSITGAQCRLQCDHCKAKILEPMIPAHTPQQLLSVVEREIASGANGMLITGGSNLRDEVEYEPFFPVIRRIKDANPSFRIAMHTALVTPHAARSMEQAGVDVAMLDVIGAQDTVTQVYHLKRPVSDFETSLAHLTRTSMRVVPHIVIGLHYGRLLGEWNALAMVARQRPHALVLVVVMPLYAAPARAFETPEAAAVGRFMLDARRVLPDVPLLLGCARPQGMTRVRIDAYATMAGLNAIAHPAEGVVELALRLGRETSISASCCSMSADAGLLDDASAVPLEGSALAALRPRHGPRTANRALSRIAVVSQ